MARLKETDTHVTDDLSTSLRVLPSIDVLLKETRSKPMEVQFGRSFLQKAFQQELQTLRTEIRDNLIDRATRESLTDILIERTLGSLNNLFAPSLRPVINLTGVILHTNLGRAPYPQAAIDAMVNVAAGASNLEYNLHNGKRGRRDDHVEHWICELTGAEAATTVNNNAAAVLLVLNTLAGKKEVIVSRGELIEIGGSFRMPAIMKKASCKLREVGTTNRTHLNDYREAIGRKTAALMKVHTSNYEINGFNKSVAASALSDLSREYAIPLIDDLGSGSLIDLTPLGLPPERTAREALSEGVDIITFSGDKLLGGPQCGIIAGSKDLIKLIDKNPMKRAMRLDKVTLGALEAVLKLYAKPDLLTAELPALRMLSRSLDQIHECALQLEGSLKRSLPDAMCCVVTPCQSQIGSGALPTKTLDSYSVNVNPGHLTAEKLAAVFRQLPIPIIGRINNNTLCFDCRSLEEPADLDHTLGALGTML